MIGSTSSMMVGIGVFDLVFRWCTSLVLNMLFFDVGMTKVDGVFTLRGATVSSCGVYPGTTLGGTLLVMMSDRSLSAFEWCSFCWVDNIVHWSCVIWRAW